MLIFLMAVSCQQVVHADEETLLQRGTYLMESIVACANCHTQKDRDGAEIKTMAYAGSFVVKLPGITAYAPNITMDVETGIGSWTDDQIIRSIREGIRPDGTIIGPPMPIPFYRTMSDRDATAIVAYLRVVEPVKNQVPKSEYAMPLPPNYGPPLTPVAEVARDNPVSYGRYLAHTLGHCTDCHTPMENGRFDFSRTGEGGRFFSGLFGLDFTAVSLNITPHQDLGLGRWTDDDIKQAITAGVSRDGRKLARVMAFSYYQKMSDEDLNAIVAYLRSLAPLPNAKR
jgi:mono/diheme cytochrome c family protein